MRLTVIGCAGSFPGPQSPASCYLISAEDDSGRTWRVLLDLGNGSLGVLQRHLPPREVDAVVLSHLHPDHCLDLCGLHVVLRYDPYHSMDHRIPVYGPVGTAPRIACAYGLEYPPGMDDFDFLDLVARSPVRVGPLTITPYPALHPVEAFALRVEGPAEDGGRAVLAYSGDTDACEGLVEAARDADLLLAEAAFQEGREEVRDVHLTGLRAGQCATRAGAKALMLTHLPAWNDPQVCLAEARSGYAGPVSLAEPEQTTAL